MTAELKAYLNKNKSNIEREEFDALVTAEVIEKGILEEMLDFLCECGVGVSTEAVTRALTDYYLRNAPAKERENAERKVGYLLNRHQITLFKTLVAK